MIAAPASLAAGTSPPMIPGEGPPVLRFITCGSVDDGKSTLIGRLLFDSKMLFDDQLATLESDSKVHGTTGGALDFALLLDGLQAEREQGITIDVAYRFFATTDRRFIVADTPGHEQYTRNMATGASTADLAVILVDARKGVLTQTRRHSYIVGLFGIRHVVLAVNKMDLIDFDQVRFTAIVADYEALARDLGLPHVQCIPVSARDGDNVFQGSARMPWYEGPTLMGHLNTVKIGIDVEKAFFRMPVQWVCRPNAEFRGYAGRVVGGIVRPGERVTVYPSGKSTTVARIVTADGDLEQAVPGQSVILTFEDEIDISRGDLLAAGSVPVVADQFSAHLLWMDEEPMLPGRQYLLRAGTRMMRATISTLKHSVNINTLEHLAASHLDLNGIAVVNLGLDRLLACDLYSTNRETGGFILIDPFNNRTVGVGILDFDLRRSSNVPLQKLDVSKVLRARQKGQRPCVLWFTGLSGSGKSTIANLVETRLALMGRHTYLLDGDNLRHGLSRDLGFTAEARVENMCRTMEVARILVDAGLIVLVSLISPFRSERQAARDLLEPGEFIEIHVATPLEECERRDPKGLYQKARSGEIPNFTGIGSPYEPPLSPELTIDTSELSPEQAVTRVVEYLQATGCFALGDQ